MSIDRNLAHRLPPPDLKLKRPEDCPIQFVPGVGPKLAQLFAEKGMSTAEELFYLFPHKYLDRRHLDSIGSLQAGHRTVVGKILAAATVFFGRRRVFEMIVADPSGAVSLKWFHFYPQQMNARFHKGMTLMVSGDVTLYRGDKQFVHPEIQILDDDLADEIAAPGIVPTYPQIPGLGQKTLRKIVRNALDRFEIPDPLPEPIRQRHHFPEKKQAIRLIHFPDEASSLDALNQARTPAQVREIFEELFLMELGLSLKRRSVKKETGFVFAWQPDEVKAALQLLPFPLTHAQKRCLHEILTDMQTSAPMHRLIQGDVGCGKTIIALVAAWVAIKNGFQVALMAPTEILAEQHTRTAQQILAPFKIPIGRLTGSRSPAERTKLRSQIRRGLYPLVIGTHALIAEGVTFKNLGLAIIDEQHRFGVLQRAALRGKGNPDVLVMTATPIPRTLAMTIYGDLDLSIIDEMPPGRSPIVTEVVEAKNRSRLYTLIGATLDRGEQGYIVYPLVEESEKLALKDATRMFEELKKVFPKRRLALLHGRIEAEEKEIIFAEFRAGSIDLLVCTTVVEVGIDVANATLMVVEHADRFGLSQLHQLRGRVGRGSKQSLCLLVSDYQKTEQAYLRLKVMVQTQDGFKIAEEDLKIRGPGDFLGTRQSGLPELRYANLLRDYPILKQAREEAFQLVEQDPDLLSSPLLRTELLRRWKERLALAEIG